MRLQTRSDLRRMKDRLDRKFFGGALKDYDVSFANLNTDELSGCCDPDFKVIQIDGGLRPFWKLTEIVMLHEMSHALLGPDYIGSRDGHGMRFDARIVKLFEIGAYDGLL